MACDIQSGFICGGQQVSERGWCDEYLYDICYELWGVVVPTRQCLVRQAAADAGSQIWIIANLVSSWATRREEKVTQCGKVPAGPCHFHKHQAELSQTSSVAITSISCQPAPQWRLQNVPDLTTPEVTRRRSCRSACWLGSVTAGCIHVWTITRYNTLLPCR